MPVCDRNVTYGIADRIGLIDGIAPHGCFGGCGVFCGWGMPHNVVVLIVGMSEKWYNQCVIFN